MKKQHYKKLYNIVCVKLVTVILTILLLRILYIKCLDLQMFTTIAENNFCKKNTLK